VARVVRIAYTNLVTAAASVIVPSSEETSLPRAALTRPLTSDRWRSKTGWTIVTGENDKIDFDRVGPDSATIAAGTYATGALLAAAIVTALEASDAVPVWACSYSAVTFKFTISSDLAFELLFGTGNTFFESSIHPDLGYTSTDKASAVSHVGEAVAYQSRHSINVDLGAATAFTSGIVYGHNVSTSGTVTLHADATTMVGVYLGPETGDVDFIQVLAGTDTRVAFFASQTLRYLRLVISDVQNSTGYGELGVWFAGVYVSPSTPQSVEESKAFAQLSETLVAAGGANHHVARTRRTEWALKWKTNSSADVAIFEALDLAMPAGRNFFLSFDATDNPTTSTVYGYLTEGIVQHRNDGALYVIPVSFVESLG
jgi:hypothetical protein